MVFLKATRLVISYRVSAIKVVPGDSKQTTGFIQKVNRIFISIEKVLIVLDIRRFFQFLKYFWQVLCDNKFPYVHGYLQLWKEKSRKELIPLNAVSEAWSAKDLVIIIIYALCAGIWKTPWHLTEYTGFFFVFLTLPLRHLFISTFSSCIINGLSKYHHHCCHSIR